MAKNAITMRELQKISAAAIEALPHSVPVKSGTRTVAMLTPLKKAHPDDLRRAEALADAVAEDRSAEKTAAILKMLAMRDAGETVDFDALFPPAADKRR